RSPEFLWFTISAALLPIPPVTDNGAGVPLPRLMLVPLTAKLPPKVVRPVPLRVSVVLSIALPKLIAVVLAVPMVKVPEVGLIVGDAPRVSEVVAPMVREALVVKVARFAAVMVVPLIFKLPEGVIVLLELKKLMSPVEPLPSCN